MLPKSKRLSTKTFVSIMGNGLSSHSPFFVIRIVPTKETSRFSVSVPKKVAKTAVMRNKIRRQAYSALKKIESTIKDGFNGVIIAKIGVEKLTFEEMMSEVNKIFVKSGILK